MGPGQEFDYSDGSIKVRKGLLFAIEPVIHSAAPLIERITVSFSLISLIFFHFNS